jgi:hypothetical protein
MGGSGKQAGSLSNEQHRQFQGIEDHRPQENWLKLSEFSGEREEANGMSLTSPPALRPIRPLNSSAFPAPSTLR